MPQLLDTNTRHELAPRGVEILLLDENFQIRRQSVVVEEARDRDGLFPRAGAGGVEGGDAGVDGARGARDGFEHGVAAEGVEVGAGEGEGEGGGDAREGEGGGEGESVFLALVSLGCGGFFG